MGFTLIETLIATGILVTGVLATATLLSYSIRSNDYTKQMVAGTVLARAKVEDLRAGGMERLVPGGSLDPIDPVEEYFDVVSANGLSDAGDPVRYLRLWCVTGANLRTITVAVFRTSDADPGTELARVSVAVGDGF